MRLQAVWSAGKRERFVTTGFNGDSDWLRVWPGFPKPIKAK